MSYHPVTLQKQDPQTDEWTDVKTLHAVAVNHKRGVETFDSASQQYHLTLTFRLAWSKLIEQVRFAPQLYRIVYKNQIFAISDYDDYMEQNLYVTVTGVAYG